MNDLKQHKYLMSIENGKNYSCNMLKKATNLYLFRYGTAEFNNNLSVTKAITVEKHPQRVEALKNLLLEAAEKIGMKERIKNYLKSGYFNITPLELRFLKSELEKMGWSKDKFVFD